MKYIKLLLSIVFTLVWVIGSPVIVSAEDDTLKFYWPFDEGTGTAVGGSSGYPGTLYGGPTWIPEGGLSFDGVNDYARTNTTLADSMGVPDQGYTLSASVQVNDANESGNIIHISNSTNGSGWCIAMLHIENGYFRAIGWDGNPVTAVDTVPAVLGQWYSIANTWSPETDTLDLYVNGTRVASTPMTTYQAADVPVYIFAGINAPSCSQNKGWFKGDIKDVRIYSRAITQEEATENANESLGTISATVSPTDNATDVAVNTNLIMTFSTETVIPGEGTIGLYTTDGDVLIEEIDVAGPQVTQDGAVITINPTADLQEATSYYVLISSGAFADTEENTYPGITSNTGWNFTTIVPPDEPEEEEEPVPRRRVIGYMPVIPVEPVTTSSLGKEGVCSSNQILTQNLRAPSRNGVFNSYTKGIVQEAKILQAHLNRLGFNSGPEDGILGPISTGAIKRMQTFLKTTPDGYVGPITRGLLNNSCGS